MTVFIRIVNVIQVRVPGLVATLIMQKEELLWRDTVKVELDIVCDRKQQNW